MNPERVIPKLEISGEEQDNGSETRDTHIILLDRPVHLPFTQVLSTDSLHHNGKCSWSSSDFVDAGMESTSLGWQKCLSIDSSSLPIESE